MKRKCFSLCLLLAAFITAKANGDPVAVHSALTLSPTPVAVHVPEVQLVDEAVSFVPRDRYMEVTVRYLLHNSSNRSFDKLPYGFPIDYIGTGKARWENRDDYTESLQEKGWRDSYIRNVSFLLNDVQLPWQCSHDSIIVPATPYISDLYFDTLSVKGRREFDSLFAIYGDSLYFYTDPISRRWYYTYLNIPAKSFVVLEVRYMVECTFYESLYRQHNNYFYNDNHNANYSYNKHKTRYLWRMDFQYDFTPAAYWGDGHAKHFVATLDASNLKFLRDLLQNDDPICDYPMQQKGKVWQYEASNFDLSTAKPFAITYYYTKPLKQPLDRIFNHRIDPSEYTITVSGADKKYPAENLSDLDPATACVLRPDKNDSIFITIRFKKPTVLDGLLLLNGYTKNAETYSNNSRIDSLFVYGDRSAKYKLSDGDTDTVIQDKKNEMLLGEVGRWIIKYRDYVPAASKLFQETPKSFDWQTLADNALILHLSRDPWGDTYYTEIRIHITATTKGLKYNDLCVSELLLIGK